MTDREKYDPLDELLDSVLAEYSAAEPRPGLETRILARVRESAATTPSAGRNWKWLWAGAIAAIAVLLFVLFAGKPSQVVPPQNNVARSPEAPAQVTSPQKHGSPAIATRPVRQERRSRRSTPAADVALRLDQRPAVFPTPAPLSQQEQLLLRYVSHTPREELIAQSHPDDPPVVGSQESDVAAPDLVFVIPKTSNTR